MLDLYKGRQLLWGQHALPQGGHHLRQLLRTQLAVLVPGHSVAGVEGIFKFES